MKRVIFILIVICILALAGYFCLKPVILFVARQQLEKVFTGAEVSIGGYNIEFFRGLELLDIRIKKTPVYDFAVGRAEFRFTPQSLLKGIIPRASLSHAAIAISQPEKSIQDFFRQLNLGGSKGAFALDSLNLSDIKLDLESKELNLKVALSLVFDLKAQSFDFCDLNIESLACAGFRLKDASLRAGQDSPDGSLLINQATYADVSLQQVQGSARLEDEMLVLDSFSAKLLGGEFKGDASVTLDSDMRYAARLQFIKLDLETIVRDFKLGEKVQLQGRLAGSFFLEGSGSAIDVLGAELAADEEGGTLTITDPDYLNNLASSTNQSLDLIVDSFKNYRYNAGVVELSLQGPDLVFDIRLEGDAGKRDLTIVLHDFKLTKED